MALQTDSESEAIESVYVDLGGEGLFGQLHLPGSSPVRDTAVLICSPWGPDEVASYRPRRAWAQRLAASGYPALRFDLPGVGNSSGTPGDPGLVGAWVSAVGTTAEWLRATSGCSRIVALGLGLGGLLAREAIAGGAGIDDLALWAAPKNGRAFTREMRNFAQLQSWSVEDGAGSEMPAGWLEVDGLVLSEETLSGLEGMDPGAAAKAPARSLLIGRNSGQAPKAIAEQLERAGSEVTVDEGGRWGAFVSHPESARLPVEIARSFETWLDAAAGSSTTEIEPGSNPAAPELELESRDSAIVEEPVTVATPSGTVFGVLSRAAGEAASDCCAIFLNAGGVRDIGPNRMWTERAREWAAAGLPAARLDAVGIGDGGGDPDGIPPGEEHFSASFEQQLELVLDALVERGLGPRFMLIGLCSGAYHGYRTAVADERVATAVLINPSALIWRSGLFSERELRKNVGWLTEGKRMKKFLRGEIGLKRIAEYAASTAQAGRKSLGRKLRNRSRSAAQEPPADWRAQLEGELDSLRQRGTRLVIAFSKEQGLDAELKRTGFVPKMEGMPNLTYTSLPANDHTLRPMVAQRGLRKLLDEQLALIPGVAAR